MKNLDILMRLILFPMLFLTTSWRYRSLWRLSIKRLALLILVGVAMPLSLSAETATNPNSCNSEYSIATLDGVSDDLSSTTNYYTSNWSTNRNIYLKFTPDTSGELVIEEGPADSSNKLDVKFFIGTSCDGKQIVDSSTEQRSHGPFKFPVTGGETYHVRLKKSGRNYMKYKLTFEFTKSSASTANYSCDGQDVESINGATSDATKSYVTEGIRGSNISRYFKFQTAVDGNIMIHQQNNKPFGGYWNHQLIVGTVCNGGSVYYDEKGSSDDNTTFAVTAGTTYYLKVREANNKNQLNFNIDFDFTADSAPPVCNGCDCSLDTPANDSSPGVAIPDLDGATTTVTKCISGLLPDDDNEYYYFTVDTDGTLDISGSTLNNKNYVLKIGSSLGGDEYYFARNTSHSPDSITLTRGDKIYIRVQELLGVDAEWQLNFTFTATTVCNGCDCSLDTDANDASPGVVIPGLNGANSDITKCISGTSESDDSDYYNFTVASEGTLNVKTMSPNGHDYHMKIISDMQGTLLGYDTGMVRDLTYTLSAGEKLTIQFKETGEDLDEWQSTFKFTKIDTCGGCDCSLDNPLNNNSPGTVIPDLDGATDGISKCISGSSISDTPDYYYFTVQSEGTLDITTSSPNGHPYHFMVGSTEGGGEYYTESGTHQEHPVSTIKLSAGDSVYIYVKETGEDLDQYQLGFEFNPLTYVENANDLCYEEIESSGMMCMDMGICSGGIGCKNTIPLRNDSNETLTDVQVLYDESGLGGSFGSECGVDPSGSCTTENDIDLGPIGLLGQATKFTIIPDIAPETTSSNSVWAKNFLSGKCFGQEYLYAEYIKDGKHYRGRMRPCGYTPDNPPDETIPTDDTNATEPICGIFADMFQTREECGGTSGSITFNSAGLTLDSSQDIIMEVNSSELDTCTLTAVDWVENDFNTCGSQGDCTASGQNAESLSINYDNPPQSVSLASNPSTSTTDVTLDGTATLYEAEYGAITTDWHTGTNTTFSISSSLKINSLKLTTDNVVAFGSDYPYNLEMGLLGIENNGVRNTISTSNKAKNIKIKELNLAANTAIDLYASQTIQFESFTVGRGGSTVTLKTPYLKINDMTFSNSGSGHADIHIIADYIDIGTLDFGQDATLTIEPFTIGKRVLFRSNSVTATSSSTMRITSGNYYMGSFDIPGTSDAASIIASDANQLINLYINGDFKPGNNPGINSTGNGGNFGSNPPANFLMYINGDLATGGGGTTFNATIYVEGDVSIENPTYIKGAVSAQSSIDIGQGQFYYDQNISGDGWGECENVIPTEPDMGQNCGIFPSVLTSYEHLKLMKNPIIQSCFISYPDGEFTDGATLKPECYEDSDMTELCTEGDSDPDNGNCSFMPPPDNKFDHIFIPSSITTDSTNRDGSVSLSEYEYGNITFGSSNQNIHFDPSTTYTDSSRKVMLLGDVVFNKNNQTLTFEEGDYYFKSLDFQENGVVIQTVGDVKLFIEGDFTYAGNGADVTDDTSSLFVHVGGDAHISSTGGGNGWLGMFIYVEGNVDIASNSNTKFYGGITAEGRVDVTGNNFQFEYNKDGATAIGFPECGCNIVQFKEAQYDISEDFENPMPPKKSVHPVIYLPGGPAQRDFNLSYTTIDGSAIRGADYVGKSETIEIFRGDSNFTLDIEIYNDPAIELDEYFYVQIYDPSPEGAACLNEYNKTKIMILAQVDSPICFEDNFESGVLDSKWRVLKSSGSFTPGIVDVNGDKRLRVTPDRYNIATAVTKDYEFETSQNLIIVEFDYHSYGGCYGGAGVGADGADGIVNVLFDSSVGDRPTPGGYGGSMGYAQMNSQSGFEGGWLGLGVDEYGNFGNCNENREGGFPSTSCDNGTGFNPQLHRNTAVIRGDGSGRSGYEYLQGIELTKMSPAQPTVAKKSGYTADGYYSGKYKMTVDARDKAHLWIRLERDYDGSGYSTIINQFDAKDAIYDQGDTPDFIRYAITSGTGGGCNNHEITWIQMRGNCQVYSVQGNFLTGPFSTIDAFRWSGHAPRQVNDHAISTKIVGQPFNIEVSSMNETNTGSETKSNVNIKYGAFDVSNNAQSQLLALRDADFTSVDTFTSEFNILKATPQAAIITYYCGDYNATDGVTKLYRLDSAGCWDTTKSDQENIYSAVEEQSALGLHLYYHTSDRFAVRPKDWTMSLANSGPYRAGSEFNFTIQAINQQGNGCEGYSEKSGDTFSIIATEHKSNCSVGEFTDTDLLSELYFDKESGFATAEGQDVGDSVSSRYSEVGIFDINITDQEADRSCEETYASIDCNDRNITGHWKTNAQDADGNANGTALIGPTIGSATINNITWIPDHFEVNATLTNQNAVGFTYLSDDLNMSSKLSLDITAQAEDNSTTINYSVLCYAKPLDLNVTFGYNPSPENYPNTLSSILYMLFERNTGWDLVKGSTTDIDSLAIDNMHITDLFPSGDHNGTAQILLKLNMDREFNGTINPFEMNVTNVKVTDNNDTSNIVVGDGNVSSSVTYLYARAKSSQPLYDDVSNSPVATPLSVVVFCDRGVIECGLFNGIDASNGLTEEYDWYTSVSNGAPNQDGNVTLVVDPSVASVASVFPVDPNSVDLTWGVDSSGVNVSHTSTALPLNVNINFGPETDSWMIYNPYDDNGTISPFYRVRFIGSSGWAGFGDTGFVVEGNVSVRKNKKMSW